MDGSEAQEVVPAAAESTTPSKPLLGACANRASAPAYTRAAASDVAASHVENTPCAEGDARRSNGM
jgi:folate-dependent phosphoribosylglycinamide formyltransferase PurN